jgi:hypothetical protein
LSALYARWAWGEARRANLLTLHVHRLDVFRAFNSLRQSVQEQPLNIQPERVATFYNPSQEAKFYFSEAKTSQLLSKYFDTCWELAKVARKPGSPRRTEGEQKKQDELLKSEDSLYKETAKQLEKELRCAVTRQWWKWICP